MATSYQPITKEQAASILSVSLRTIDNFIADGIIPMPTAIGRRVYWHPEAFYAWLDVRLGAPARISAPNDCLAQPTRTGRPRNVSTMINVPAGGAGREA